MNKTRSDLRKKQRKHGLIPKKTPKQPIITLEQNFASSEIAKQQSQPGSLELNLQKAMAAQEQLISPVTDFLGPQLLKYKDVFIENGFDDLTSILEIQDEHLKEMNVPLGHKLKILKRVREHPMKREKENQAEKANMQV